MARYSIGAYHSGDLGPGIEMTRFLLLLLSVVQLSACAGRRADETFRLADVSADEAARIVVYRPETSYHRANPELPFIFVDGTQAGKLAIGSAVNLVVPPGEHTLVIREPVLFMPGRESGTVKVNAEPRGTYYVRYGREWSGDAIVIPKGPTALGSETRFERVSEETGKARR